MSRVIGLNTREELKLKGGEHHCIEMPESNWYTIGQKIPLTTSSPKLLSFIPSLPCLKAIKKKKTTPTPHNMGLAKAS